MFLFVIIFISSSLFSMERQDSVGAVREFGRSPSSERISVESSNSNGSHVGLDDEDDLCEVALSRFMPDFSGLAQGIKPFLRSLLHESKESPLLQRHESNVEVLKRIKSSDENAPVSPDRANVDLDEKRIRNMVMVAIHKALEEKEKEIQAREKRIKEKYSGKKTAAIAAITATIATIVSTICTTMITLNSK